MNSKDYPSSPHTKEPDQAIRQLAARQFGVVGRSQALDAGLTPHLITYRLQSGDLRRALPSVYTINGAPADWPQPLMAGQLWAGPEAVVSHRAAAALWKLDGVDARIVELTTTAGRGQVPPGIVLHRTRLITPSDHGLLGPFHVTGIPRTLIDLGSVADSLVVEAALESAYRRDETLLARLADRLEVLGAQGRDGIGSIRDILAAREPGAAPTEGMFETRFLRLLKDHGLPIPVRQYEVWKDGLLIARIDFAYPQIRLALDTDGYWCHMGRRKWRKGLRRGNSLTLLGWRSLHITWDDVVHRPEGLVDDIRQAYAQTF